MDNEFEITNENLFEQLQQYLSNFDGELNVNEEQIDVNIQMEYLKTSSALKSNIDADQIMLLSDDFYNPTNDIEKQKEILVKLAAINDVKAFRKIEKIISESDGEINGWAKLAFQESKMLLQTTLLDKKQLFISTGLGGKGLKLRYFIALISKELEILTEFQKSIIKNEFDYLLKKAGAEVEQIQFTDQYIRILAIIPINISIAELLSGVINECNQYGNFLRQDYLVTNVKELNNEEITEIITKQSSDDNTEFEIGMS